MSVSLCVNVKAALQVILNPKMSWQGLNLIESFRIFWPRKFCKIETNPWANIFVQKSLQIL